MKEKPEMLLRLEQSSDYRQVEYLTREAFWNLHVPGCDEHYLVHILREDVAFVPELDFVAVVNEKIVGNIMYAKCKLLQSDGVEHDVLSFGPVSVLPQFQGTGVGSALIRHTLALAKDLGHKLVAIYGDPLYYCRFGFVAAEKYKICSSDGYFSPALQVLELVPGSLDGINGRFHEAVVYHIDAEAASIFDATFEAKEKKWMPSQKRFEELVGMAHL